MVNQLQEGLPRVKAARIQDFNSEAFWSKQAMLQRDQLFRLCQYWSTIPEGWRWPAPPCSLFLATNSPSRVQLKNPWQGTPGNNLLLQRMAARVERDRHACADIDWLQKAWIFHDHKKVNAKTSEVNRVSIRVQLCHQLSKQQKK